MQRIERVVGAMEELRALQRILFPVEGSELRAILQVCGDEGWHLVKPNDDRYRAYLRLESLLERAAEFSGVWIRLGLLEEELSELLVESGG